ncbi:MAG: DUF1631 domain-containing protein [Gammaproteobacteria bacterium]|nr:DUF1631 domain-containing protein [Gammaproteobacteria bacterium]
MKKQVSETSASTINTSDDRYISDPEYISKIINQFILSEDQNKSNQQASKAQNSQQYNRDNVIDALTSLQLSFKPKYIPGQTVNINTDEFKSALINSMAKMDKVSIPKTMNQIDSRTIDFVEMIFGAFLRDKNISDAIKDLLLSLQIPIIKTALIDKKLFNNEKHPARHVLNSIAHIGIGIETKDNPTYKTIQYIIDQLLHSYDRNIEIFKTAMTALARLENIENSKHEKTEKETQHLIKMEHGRQLVLKELQYHTLNISIPDAIQPLILSHWSSLMFSRLMNHGKDSIEWREAIGILRLLMKSLRSIESRDDWIALRSIYKGIVNSIRSSLSNTLQNKEKIFIATSNLNNYFFKKLSESEFKSDPDKINDNETTPVNIIELFNDKEFDDFSINQTESRTEYCKELLTKQSDIIKIGNWFEVFTDYNHPLRRLKLSILMEDEARLIFVDYMGNKVIEKNLETFITELKNDQSRLINDHSIFEYALSMVIISIAAKN